MSKQFILFLLTCFLASGCIKDSNPPIPAYIYVPNIRFIPSADSLNQGSSSQIIRDAWISVDGQLIGVNVLPTLLPVILDESIDVHTIMVRAGIFDQGIANKRTDYSFFTRYTEHKQLRSGQIDTINATVSYDSLAKFIVIEDFEDSGVEFGECAASPDNNPNTRVSRTNEDVFEGSFSGKIVVDSANRTCITSTISAYTNLQINNSGSPVYMEMNYKTNVPIQIGIIANSSRGSNPIYKGGVNPKDTWNKIYFNFTTEVFSENADSYQLVLYVQVPLETVVPQIYIDNIKLIHY